MVKDPLIPLCKWCVYATETDKPSSMVDFWLWCESKCWLTRKNQTCNEFFPKRKYRDENFYIVKVPDARKCDKGEDDD